MKFKFTYKKKNFELEVEEYRTIFSKFRGLMFGKNSKPLLFVFGKPTRQAIHSFFCKPFIAVWFNGINIVDVKSVNKWVFWIQPKGKFDKLLEIPSESSFFKIFLDEAKV